MKPTHRRELNAVVVLITLTSLITALLLVRGESWFAALLIPASATGGYVVDRFPRILPAIGREWRLISLVAGLLAAVLVPVRAPDLDFYTTSAQVIPVFMLVVILELRLQPSEPREALPPRASLISMLLLVAGEFLAFQAIVRDEGGPTQYRWVVGALVFGVTAVSVNALAITGPNDPPRPTDTTDQADTET